MFTDDLGYARHTDNTREHRRIAEQVLGRKLLRNDIVHHVDYDKNNNQKSNLVICDRPYHNLIHARTDCLRAGFHPDTHSRCSFHKCYEPIENFTKDKHQWNGLCAVCKEAARLTKKPGPWGWRGRLMQQYRRVPERNICWIARRADLCS